MRKHITAALLAAITSAASAEDCTQDNWLCKDKAVHATGSALIAGAVTAATKNAFLGFGAALVVGAAKEAYDSKHPGKHTASWKDFGADALGGLAGAELGGLVLAPADRGIVVGFRRAF